ncbi:hypothetical protein D3C85_1510180 [compost metagenome]
MVKAVVQAFQGAVNRLGHLRRLYRACEHDRDQGLQKGQVGLAQYGKAGLWRAGRAATERGGQAGAGEQGRALQADPEQAAA